MERKGRVNGLSNTVQFKNPLDTLPVIFQNQPSSPIT